VLADPNQPPNAQLPAGVTFDWPTCDIGSETVDLQEFPPKEERIHDIAALTDLEAGAIYCHEPCDRPRRFRPVPRRVVRVPVVLAGAGGFEDAPFFGRNYNVGLEPCTSIPNAGIEAAVENDTANEIGPGETVTATIEVETHDPNGE